jgi:hypothetical protein
MSDIRKRMAHVRAALHEPAVWLKSDRRHQEKLYKEFGWDPLELDRFYEAAGGIAVGSSEHYDALKRAKEYFGVDDDRDAAMAMAMVLFGQHGRGRAKGTKTWTYQKYLHFAEAHFELREKDKTLSDAEICRRLGKGGDANSEFKDYDPDYLRTLIPGARRAVLDYAEDMAIEEGEARRKGEL